MKKHIRIPALAFTTLLVMFLGVYLAKGVVEQAFEAVFEHKASEITARTVTVGSVEYLPPGSLLLRDISVVDKEEVFSAIKGLAIGVDLWRYVLGGWTVVSVKFEGLEIKDNLRDAHGEVKIILRGYSPMSGKMPDISFLREVEIKKFGRSSLDAGAFGDNAGEELTGKMSFGRGALARADLNLLYNDVAYRLYAERFSGKGLEYGVSVSSEGLNAGGSLRKKGNDVYLDRFEGYLFVLPFGIKGSVKGLFPFSGALVELEADGSLSLEDMADLPDAEDMAGLFPKRTGRALALLKVIEYLVDEFGIRGEASARLFLKGTGPKMNGLTAGSEFEVSGLTFGGTSPGEFSGAFALHDKKLHTKDVSGTISGGSFEAQLSVNMADRSIPYRFNLTVKDVLLDGFFSPGSFHEEALYGTLGGTIACEGTVTDLSASSVSCVAVISGARFPDMPLFRPFFRDVRRKLISEYGVAPPLGISSASAKVEIADRRFRVENMNLWDDNFYLTLGGSVGFRGELDLDFTVGLRGIAADIAASVSEGTHPGIYGGPVLRGRLRGSVADPYWAIDR